MQNKQRHRSAIAAYALFFGFAAHASAEVSLKLSPVQARAAGIKVEPAQVAASTPSPDGATRGVRLAGRVVAPGDASGAILSTVSGQLESVLVQIGAPVRTGQPLARIASPELAALQREYLQARSASELAARRLARDEALFQDGIISESRLQDTRAARQSALAAEHEQRRHLSMAGYTDAAVGAIQPAALTSSVTIHAPRDAVVLQQTTPTGAHVEPGAELLRLSASRDWWLELQASARDARAIRVGDIVTLPACKGTGRVIAVGTQFNAASQTLTIRGELRDGASDCVRANQYVEADVHPASAPAGLVSVPAGALLRSADRDYVFVERGSAFTPVPVMIARRQGESVWLQGGVAPGTRVATAGISALKGAWLGFGTALESSGVK
jgi:RND family efflux transporter MFP subunit